MGFWSSGLPACYDVFTRYNSCCVSRAKPSSSSSMTTRAVKGNTPTSRSGHLNDGLGDSVHTQINSEEKQERSRTQSANSPEDNSLGKFSKKLQVSMKLLKPRTDGDNPTTFAVVAAYFYLTSNGQIMLWSRKKPPYTYEGVLGSFFIEDVAEVAAHDANDTVLVITAFEHGDGSLQLTDGAKQVKHYFKFRKASELRSWVLTFDEYVTSPIFAKEKPPLASFEGVYATSRGGAEDSTSSALVPNLTALPLGG